MGCKTRTAWTGKGGGNGGGGPGTTPTGTGKPPHGIPWLPAMLAGGAAGTPMLAGGRCTGPCIITGGCMTLSGGTARTPPGTGKPRNETEQELAEPESAAGTGTAEPEAAAAGTGTAPPRPTFAGTASPLASHAAAREPRGTGTVLTFPDGPATAWILNGSALTLTGATLVLKGRTVNPGISKPLRSIWAWAACNANR